MYILTPDDFVPILFYDWSDASPTFAGATFTGDVSGIALNEIEDPTVDHTFTMANKSLTWRFTNPSGGFFMEWIGAAGGHLFELNQNTGAPASGTHLLHLEWASTNVSGLHLEGPSSTAEAILTDVTGDAQKRFVLDNSGKLSWGSGSAAQDVSLYRDGVGSLTMSGGLNLVTSVNSSTTQLQMKVEGVRRGIFSSTGLEIQGTNLKMPNNGYIGSLGNTSAMQIASSGAVTFDSDIVWGGGTYDVTASNAGSAFSIYPATDGAVAMYNYNYPTNDKLFQYTILWSRGAAAAESMLGADWGAGSVDQAYVDVYADPVESYVGFAVQRDSDFEFIAFVNNESGDLFFGPNAVSSNNQVDLGLSTNLWRNLNLGGDATIAGNVGIGEAPSYPLDIRGVSSGTPGIFVVPGTGLVTESTGMTVNNRAHFGYDGSTQNVLISDNGTSKSIGFDIGGSRQATLSTSGLGLLLGHLGVGSSPSSSASVNVTDAALNTDVTYFGLSNSHTKTDGVSNYADDLYGIYNYARMNQPGGEIGGLFGIYNIAILTDGSIGAAGNIENIQGTYNAVQQVGGVVTNAALASYNVLDLNGGGISGNVYGIYVLTDQEAGHTIGTNFYGVRINSILDGTVTGTAYGLYIDQAGLDTAIRQVGAIPNYLDGPIFLNDTTGNSQMTTGITINQGAAGDEIMAFKSSDVTHPLTAYAEADTYLSFTKVDDLAGGALLRGFSDSGSYPFIIQAFFGTTNPTDTTPAIRLDAFKSDGGTGRTSLADAETIGAWTNAGTSKWSITGNGEVTQTGSLFVNETTNTFMATVGITVNQGSGSGEVLALKSSDVSQPATALHEADTYGAWNKNGDTQGGLAVTGMTDTDYAFGALQFLGIMGTSSPTATYPAIRLSAFKSNGSTSIAALADTERIMDITNGGTAKWYMTGNGLMYSPATYANDMNGDTYRDCLVNSNGEFGYDSSTEKNKDVRTYHPNTEWIHALMPVEYSPKTNPNKVKIGLLAEDTDLFAPYESDIIVYDERREPASINYKELIVPLLAEVQKLRREVDALKQLQ